MQTFYTISYIISSILAILTFSAVIYCGKYHHQSIRILPKALRLFLTFCYCPFVIMNTMCNFTLAVICLIYEIQNNYITDIINIITSFATQNIRNFFFTIIFERIIATVLLDKYQLSYRKILSVYLTILSQGISLCYVLFLIYSRFVASTVSAEVFTYYIFTIHALTIIICMLLYYLNMRMYKITVYKVTLKKRHQIVENVKVLTFAFSSILIYTILAPFGSLIAIVAFAYKFPPLPYCIGHIFNNLPHLIICIRLILRNRKMTKQTTVKCVQNALGKRLPVMLTNDNYFKNLQQQWK